MYRNSPARMFFRSLLTRGAGSSSACSATSPRRSSASSGGALVLGLLGAARWCRLLTQRRVRQCSGGGARGSCSACSTFFTCRQHRPGAARFRCCCSSTIVRTFAHCFAAYHTTGAARRPHMRDIEIGEELFAPQTGARGSWSACSARRSSHHTQGWMTRGGSGLLLLDRLIKEYYIIKFSSSGILVLFFVVCCLPRCPWTPPDLVLQQKIHSGHCSCVLLLLL